MGRSTDDAQIIQDLERRLNDANASVAWYKNELSMRETEQIERLIELMETKAFSQWFDEVMVRENESLGTAIADIVEDQIDYSDVFRERVNDIISTETYELKSDIKDEVRDDLMDELDEYLSNGIKDLLKDVRLKVGNDD